MPKYQELYSMYLCMKQDLIEICLKDMWWVIPSASHAAAVTEPLESAVGAEFGKKSYGSQAVAVTEPLESIIRAGKV